MRSQLCVGIYTVCIVVMGSLYFIYMSLLFVYSLLCVGIAWGIDNLLFIIIMHRLKVRFVLEVSSKLL